MVATADAVVSCVDQTRSPSRGTFMSFSSVGAFRSLQVGEPAWCCGNTILMSLRILRLEVGNL